MTKRDLTWRRRRGEHGQTILLVVVSLVSLLGMAALAIDVVTLFVAHTEIQRAADAAALAGAKAIADSGATTDITYIALAQTMAKNVISDGGGNGILQQNLVAGRPPQLVGLPVFDFVTHGNSDPTIIVTLQQTNLPTFFARIWGRRLATVSATATAEAYNPSGSQAVIGETVPIEPKCVKPWLLANINPNGGGALINDITGAVVAADVPRANPFTLISACPAGACLPPIPLTLPGQYWPGVVAPGSAQAVPSCAAGGSDFEQGIAGCDPHPYACGGTVPQSPPTAIDILNLDLKNLVPNAVQCLIHAGGVDLGQGQDEIIPGDPDTRAPAQILAGSSNPLIGAGSPPVAIGDRITTSSSIATIPIIDGTIYPGNQVKVIGFMQAFVTRIVSLGGVTGITVAEVKPLNISGCGNTLAGPPPGPVSAGGVSPIPVRLIHQ